MLLKGPITNALFPQLKNIHFLLPCSKPDKKSQWLEIKMYSEKEEQKVAVFVY